MGFICYYYRDNEGEKLYFFFVLFFGYGDKKDKKRKEKGYIFVESMVGSVVFSRIQMLQMIGVESFRLVVSSFSMIFVDVFGYVIFKNVFEYFGVFYFVVVLIYLFFYEVIYVVFFKKYGKWGKVFGSGVGGIVCLIKGSFKIGGVLYVVKEFRLRR